MKLFLFVSYPKQKSKINYVTTKTNEKYIKKAANAYIAGVPAASNPYNPYFAPGQLVPTILGPDPSTATATISPQMTQCVPQQCQMPQQQKIPRSDRIEVSPAYLFASL